jgi:HD-GYP domain-containing protein (c-di-GMP phosphodiesterase class II)
VRILTISDIFAALVEARTYKPTMPTETAYETLLEMKTKLERPLVAAFREVALKEVTFHRRAIAKRARQQQNPAARVLDGSLIAAD